MDINKKAAKNFKNCLFSIIVVLILIGTVNILVDPYFHYHRPFFSYRLYDERYINDGISRHFAYDAVITGNSLTQNFKTSQCDKLFNVKSIKLPYSGAWYRELWESLDRTLSYNSNVKMAIVGMDMHDLVADSKWQRYDDMPEYLYDDFIWNDVNYLFNKTILYRGTLNSILHYVNGDDSTSFDEYSSWVRDTGPYEACCELSRIEYQDYNREFTIGSAEYILDNLNTTMIPIIEKYPSVNFKLVVPPSSVAKWAEYYEDGEVLWRIKGVEFAIEKLSEYDNVEVYAFDDAFDITSNLHYYSDAVHFDSFVNEWMLNSIYNGEHLVGLSNLTTYINKISDFYGNYNYVELNQYIK